MKNWNKTRWIALGIMVISITISAQSFEPVPFDKKYHIGAGTVIGVWGTFTGNSLELTPEQSALFGVATATAAGLGKEIWDISWCLLGDKHATFDTMDIAATTLGGIVGAGLTYLGMKVFKKKTPVIYGMVNDNAIQVGVKIKL